MLSKWKIANGKGNVAWHGEWTRQSLAWDFSPLFSFCFWPLIILSEICLIRVGFQLLMDSLFFDHTSEVFCRSKVCSWHTTRATSLFLSIFSSLLSAHAPTALVLFFLSILWPPAHFLGLTDTLWTAHALVPSSFSPFPLPSSLLLLTVHSFYAAPVRSCHFLQSADYLTADVGVFDHFLLQILEPRALLIMMMLQAALVLNKVQLGVFLCQGSRILLLADIPAQTWPDHLFSTVQSLLHVFAVSSLSWIHWWHLVNVQVFCQTDINLCCSNSSFFFLAAQAK